MRRNFHRPPELGFEEYWFQEQVLNYLSKLRFDVSKIAGTGVVTLLRGAKPGKTVLLRSDMDALPEQEETGLPFASESRRTHVFVTRGGASPDGEERFHTLSL